MQGRDLATLEKIDEERYMRAMQEKEINDMISGVAEKGMSEELQRMRDLRQKVKANARISKELAGTDTKTQEAEFLEYARQSESSAEFDALIGLAVVVPLAFLVRSGLAGVSPVDPYAVLGGVGILLVGALVATLVPAARVLSLDPMVVLRDE